MKDGVVDISIKNEPDPALMREIGRRLRALRKAIGLNQSEVAERAGLDRTTISRAERGDNPTLLTMIRLLRVYGRLDALETFIPVAEVSPLAVMSDRKGRGATERRQARGSAEAGVSDG